MLKVGLLVGREWSFPPAFVEEVGSRQAGVEAELVRLGGTRMDEPVPYAVLVDRISHEVPYYRSYLKYAAAQGVAILNDPFLWAAGDKFFQASLAHRLGVPHPKTVALPNKEYVPGVVHAESLRNLVYPLDWDGILDYVGVPCVLKDAHGGGRNSVSVCRSRDELIAQYDRSGLRTMVVQEFVAWEEYFRCLCLGGEDVLVIKYDPVGRRYLSDTDQGDTPLGRRVVDCSLRLVRALGYDVDALEWAVRDGVPYAIDFLNPVPDLDVYSPTPAFFRWAVTRLADLAIKRAKEPRPPGREGRWGAPF